MKGLDYTALTVAIIGAVNWGLIGFFRLDLVALIFGNMTWLSRIIYAVVGICGLVPDLRLRKNFRPRTGTGVRTGNPLIYAEKGGYEEGFLLLF